MVHGVDGPHRTGRLFALEIVDEQRRRLEIADEDAALRLIVEGTATATGEDGTIYVSDSNHNRVNAYTESGEVLWSLGEQISEIAEEVERGEGPQTAGAFLAALAGRLNDRIEDLLTELMDEVEDAIEERRADVTTRPDMGYSAGP